MKDETEAVETQPLAFVGCGDLSAARQAHPWAFFIMT
mgnify:CR=1 FL=1